MRIIHSCCIALVLLALSACTKDEVVSQPVDESDFIRFNVSRVEDEGMSRALRQDYGKHIDNMVLHSGTSPDTLGMGVYVQESIDTQSLPISRGAVLTADNLTSFGVYASKQEEGEGKQSFFKNLKVTRDASTGDYSSETAYYWPGAMYTLGFIGIAPYHPQGLSVDNNGALPTMLDYTVPALATEQSDLMLGVTHEYNGDDKTPVHLEFRHLCSAVNVKVGSIPEGSIKAITFKNIYNKGTYTLADDVWSVNNASKDNFMVDFVGTQTEYPTYGIVTENPQINDASATFMMIPQTLPDDAEIEITFVHTNTGREETLSAGLKGAEWVMGQTNNYLISITPDYILEFETEEVPMQDAHFEMAVVKLKAKYLDEGWTLNGTTSDGSTVTFCDTLTTLQQSGYWIEEDRGASTLTSTKQGDEVTVYAFLEENVGEEIRTINLSLKPAADVYKDRPAKTLQISQLCPAWNAAGLGCERTEEGIYPWGFSWDENTKVTYTFSSSGFWGAVYLAVINWYIGRLDLDYITKTGWIVLQSVTIDFSKINATNVAKSETDGLKNTNELYNFNGVSDASDFMNQLEAWGGTPDKTLSTNPAEFAARACAMKNKYNKTSQTTNGQTIDTPVLKDENFVWFLPAKNEITAISDGLYPMTGIYWTSTSEPNGDNEAYIYTAGEGTELRSRSEIHKVRAARKKP